MTQEELAVKLGVTQTRISELESGKRPISRRMAEKLSDESNTLIFNSGEAAAILATSRHP